MDTQAKAMADTQLEDTGDQRVGQPDVQEAEVIAHNIEHLPTTGLQQCTDADYIPMLSEVCGKKIEEALDSGPSPLREMIYELRGQVTPQVMAITVLSCYMNANELAAQLGCSKNYIKDCLLTARRLCPDFDLQDTRKKLIGRMAASKAIQTIMKIDNDVLDRIVELQPWKLGDMARNMMEVAKVVMPQNVMEGTESVTELYLKITRRASHAE